MTTQDEPQEATRTRAGLIHLGGVLTVFLVPLAGWLAGAKSAKFTRDHAAQALNFQITVALGYIIAGILLLIPVVWLPIAWAAFVLLILYDVIFSIRAASAAFRGHQYSYPFAIHFVTP